MVNGVLHSSALSAFLQRCPTGQQVPCSHVILRPEVCSSRGRRCATIVNARDQRSSWRSAVTNVTIPVMPTELLRSDFTHEQGHPDIPLTVYSCRFSTGYGRGTALSDPNSGVNICLIGKDGRSVLHRISPVNDPVDEQHEVERMCEIIDDDSIGADCSTVRLSTPTSQQNPTNTNPSNKSSSASNGGYTLPPRQPPQPRLRFQEGHVDEITFLAPEVGPLAGVLVGTEHGTWMLEEMQVASSRSSHIDRFICKQTLGAQAGQGAACLTPVPPGAVVYGSGDTQVTLTKEQATALHTVNMDAYDALKQRLLNTTLILAASGTWVAGLTGGLDFALPFAVGGATGIAYQWLLQQSVDNIVATVTPPSKPYVNMHGDEKPLKPSAAATTGQHAQANTSGGSSSQFQAVQAFLQQNSSIRKLSTSPAARIALLAAATVLTLSLMSTTPEEPSKMSPVVPLAPSVNRQQLGKCLVGLMGFMTYKVALITVSISSPPVVDTTKSTASPASSSKSKSADNN